MNRTNAFDAATEKSRGLAHNRRPRELRTDLTILALTFVIGMAVHAPVWIGSHFLTGGDKTAFFLGLMAHYGQLLRQGALPWWNDWWGFGFPGVAESQVGAFYLPHLVLYRLMAPIEAFRWSFLLHRAATPAIAYAAVRLLGLRPRGSLLAAIAFAWGGFATVHVDHQWAVEGLLWFPPMVALGLRILDAPRWWMAPALAPILALLLLIGHFQIAFFGLVTLALAACHKVVTMRTWRPAARLAVPLGIGLLLASVQLGPTAALAGYLRGELGANQGTDYLSTHATPPWFLPGLYWPYVYYREPLWRELVWTPARAAPEESLTYVGALTLTLALGALRNGRRRPFVQIFALVLIVATALTWAPFLPGFSSIASIPGFSFFRAWARWTLVRDFGLGVLAGWTLDRLRTPRGLRSACRWTVTLAFLVAALPLLGWWSAQSQLARGQKIDALTASLIRCVNPMQSAATTVRDLAQARTPDPYTVKSWVLANRPFSAERLPNHWGTVFRMELAPTLAVLGILFALSLLSLAFWPGGRWTQAVAIGLVSVDLAIFSWAYRDIPTPRERLAPEGPTIQKLRELPVGARILGPMGNLLQLWQVSNVRAYRTLDVPRPSYLEEKLAAWENQPTTFVNDTGDLGQLLGVQTVVTEAAAATPPIGAAWITDDDQIEQWLTGGFGFRRLLEKRSARLVLVGHASKSALGAIAVASAPISNERRSELSAFHATPLYFVDASIERGPGDEWIIATPAACHFVLGRTYTPGWFARVVVEGTGELERETPAKRFADYWLAVELPRAGRFRVTWSYEPPGRKLGMAMTAGGLLAWVLLAVCSVRRG